jgi:hypothetical protein
MIRSGSIDKDFLVHASDLVRLLKFSESDITRLVRAGIITRVPDPSKRKTFLYPCFENIRRYVEFRFGQRDAINQQFLTAKAGREDAQRIAAEISNQKELGALVDKQKLTTKLEMVVTAYRDSMLARTDRLVNELQRTKSPKEKRRRLHEADLAALTTLSGLFKVMGTSDLKGNGTRKS